MTTRSELDWRARLPEGIRPYFEAPPLAALFLGISSGFAFSMIGATLTTRLAQHGITKSAVTAFALTFLAYNFKFLWAPIVDNVRLPLIGRFGQRRSWLWLVGVLVMLAVAFLGVADPGEALYVVAIAAIAVGVAGATFDIIIDAYRIELLEPRQLGVGSGMSQYGWRIGSAAAGALALVLAHRYGWASAYAACAAFALPALLVCLGMKRSVLASLVLMAVSNLSFAALAAAGHTNTGMALAVGFENFASGIGGVTVVAYLSALCNLRFTATQYALLSALASIAGRFF